MSKPIRIAILANASQARRVIGDTSTRLERLGASVGKASKLAALGGVAALAGFAKASVSLEAEYSTKMRLIQAATKATGSTMGDLNDLAIKLGADTSFSASEAASAMLELAKAGIDTKTIMGGGLAGTLQLAAAGGTELGTAATIASNALNAFSLSGRDMAEVAAALAGGANASSASVESLGQGLSQVGPGAVNAGLSLQQTVAALSAFDAAGIKGSDAGTSLKTMLSRLVPQTERAASAMDDLGLNFVKGNGEFESLENIAGQLQKRLGKLSDAQRTTALNTIFGSDASRAATVLIKEGSEGIREYVRATKDQSAAQKAAEARMGGTAGAMERLSGSIETAQLRLGQELAPVIVNVSDFLADRMVPATEAVIDTVKGLIRTVEPAVRFLAELPGPVKEIGVQAGIAALILPRLSAAVTTAGAAYTTATLRAKQFHAEMTYGVTRTQRLTAVTQQLGSAARSAAGIGGMVALTQGAQTANEGLQALANIGGGAMLGFATGGPIGAAIGAAAGGIKSFYDVVKNSSSPMEELAEANYDYKKSLDEATGALSRMTIEQIKQNLVLDGGANAARNLGIPMRDVIGYIQGNEGAIRRVSGALDELYKIRPDDVGRDFVLRREAINRFNDSVGLSALALRRNRSEVREAAREGKSWGAVLKNIPVEVRTELRQVGFRPSIANLRQLQREHKLTPKQLRLIIRETGAKATIRSVDGVVRIVKKAEGDVVSGERTMGRAGSDIAKALLQPLLQAKPDLRPYRSGVESGARAAQGPARTGGSQVGSALKSGTLTGLAGLTSALAAQMASAVRTAVAAAKREGQIKSPSRKTMEIGENLADGMVLGLRKRQKKAKTAGQKLMQQVLSGINKGDAGDASGIFRNIENLVEKTLKKRLKGSGQAAAASKRVLKSLRDERAELTRALKQRDKINRKLDEAKQNLADLKQQSTDYAESVRQSILGFGNVTSFLQSNTAFTASTASGSIINDLKKRLGLAKEYASLIQTLTSQGLNKTTIQQLIDAGVEGGLATAQALAAGGQSAVNEVNALTAELDAVGQSLGSSTANTMYQAGIDAAAGLVAGLQSQQKQLDKVAKRLGKALVDAVKKQLGIKSPSRVFRGVGDDVVRGLALGLDDVYVKRQGTRMATALQGGFGEPRLSARAAWDATAGRSEPVRVEADVRLTAEQISMLQRGRVVQMELDAWHGSGGRSKAP